LHSAPFLKCFWLNLHTLYIWGSYYCYYYHY